MDFAELNSFAYSIIVEESHPTQAELRRAISALYYGLFHALVAAGSSAFAAGGVELQAQVARAYAHRAMREVCRILAQPRTGPLRKPQDGLLPSVPDPGLKAIARAFLRLQEARETADYDLTISYTRQDAIELLQLANGAHQALWDIRGSPQRAVFLAALLLHDRWTRRG
jgi:hypothetical protein